MKKVKGFRLRARRARIKQEFETFADLNNYLIANKINAPEIDQHTKRLLCRSLTLHNLIINE